jgi:hypothetical protein
LNDILMGYLDFTVGELQEKVGNPYRLTLLSTLLAEKGFRPTFRSTPIKVSM